MEKQGTITKCEEGQCGIGAKGYSKYDTSADGAVKNGGNDAEQGDGIVKEQSPESMYGGNQGSLDKAKG